VPSRSLTRVYLRANDARGSVRYPFVKVAMLGSYDPALLGEPGDVVLLSHRGPIQFAGDIPFEDLLEYRVVSRASRVVR
jgi:hypothetical protein